MSDLLWFLVSFLLKLITRKKCYLKYIYSRSQDVCYVFLVTRIRWTSSITKLELDANQIVVEQLTVIFGESQF